jgi:hypothetical protein
MAPAWGEASALAAKTATAAAHRTKLLRIGCLLVRADRDSIATSLGLQALVYFAPHALTSGNIAVSSRKANFA